MSHHWIRAILARTPLKAADWRGCVDERYRWPVVDAVDVIGKRGEITVYEVAKRLGRIGGQEEWRAYCESGRVALYENRHSRRGVKGWVNVGDTIPCVSAYRGPYFILFVRGRRPVEFLII